MVAPFDMLVVAPLEALVEVKAVLVLCLKILPLKLFLQSIETSNFSMKFC